LMQTGVNGQGTFRGQGSWRRQGEDAGPCPCPPTHPREGLHTHVTRDKSENENHKHNDEAVFQHPAPPPHHTAGQPSFRRREFWRRSRPRALIGVDDLFSPPPSPRIYGVGRLFSVIVGVNPAHVESRPIRRLVSKCRQRIGSNCMCACAPMTAHMVL